MPRHSFLMNALLLGVTNLVVSASLISGSAPAAPRYVPLPSNTLTFNKHIAPIIFDNCATCHRPGEVAPFPLLNYGDVKKRARQIAVITQQRIMPPWKPEPGYGKFLHERWLTDAQIATLQRWATQGAVKGKPADLPPTPRFPASWQLGKPDLIITMPKPVTIPADGPDVNRSYVIHVHLPADKYVRVAEFRPGNRRIVHHATVMLDASGKARAAEAKQGEPGSGFAGGMGFGPGSFVPSGSLGGYVPGMMSNPTPPGAPTVLPKDVDVVFGMHYHPSGKPETDQSSIGLYFTDKPPKRIGSVILMGVLNLEIQPGETAHPETDTFTLPVDVEMQSIAPHMHLIGKTVKMWAELPDGTTRPLIRVNDWDFNWQGTYSYAQPFRLPKGTKIRGEWTHDNTFDNPRNPNNPPKVVKNGENSTDEMAAAWIPVVVDTPQDNGALWMANLGHLLQASLTPPVRVRPTPPQRLPGSNTSHSGSTGPQPSVGLFALSMAVSAVTDLGITLIETPLHTFVVLLTSLFVGCMMLLLVPARLWPTPSARAADLLTVSPLRCFGLGILSLTIFICLVLPMLFASTGTQVLGLVLWLGFCMIALVGSGGLARWAGQWFCWQRGLDIPFVAIAKGSLLTMCLIFAPVLGWFVVLPLIIICSLGAGVSALWSCFDYHQRACAHVAAKLRGSSCSTPYARVEVGH